MAWYSSEHEIMPLNKPRFEHYEPDSNNEQLLDFERDIMAIEELNDVDRNEELKKVSLINGKEKATVDSCGQKDISGTRILESSQDYESVGFADKIRIKEKFEKEKQELIDVDRNEELKKASLINGKEKATVDSCGQKDISEHFKEDNNEELEKVNLTNCDANPPLNNCEKPKQEASKKESTGKGQTKRRINLTKNLSAKHLKLKDKQKKATNKGKTDTRSIHKQGFHKDVFNQDNAVTKSNNSHCGSYIPRKKLNQSSRLGMLLLAVLCIVNISEESSVTWRLRSLVYFGKTAILDCILNETSNICHNDTVIRRWSKDGDQSTRILTINENSSNKSKYEGEVNKECTVSSLIIKNFDQSDIGDYTCGFGLKEYSKELKLEGGNFRSYPAKENINGFLVCSHSNLRLDLKMRNIFPGPKCYSDIKNVGLKHKRVRTDISGVLYTTEDTVEFVLKDHSCSGTIRTFCLFEETKIEVFNRTYNCCPDSHSSLALKVSMSCLSVITFAVIMCFVYLCTRKKIGFMPDFFLRRNSSSGTALSGSSSSM